MPAVLFNCALILAGSALGLALNNRIPPRFMTVLTQAMGLCVVSIGISAAIGTQTMLCVILCLTVGALLGEGIDIEGRLDKLGDWLKRRFIRKAGGSFTEGFVTASVLFCVGAMAIMGAIEAGVHHDYAILISKSVIDGVIAVSLAATLGVGAAFSALPILIYEGGMTLLAGLVANVLQEAVVTEMSAVGGCIILGIGLNLLKISKVHLKVGNLLPAIFLPLAYFPLASLLGGFIP